ncbi:MAG: hypothetical protein PVH92_09460, partial [Anaerolineales bacterium]
DAPGLLQILITASLLLHGIAHAIALVALIGQSGMGKPKRKIITTSWLFQWMLPRKAALILMPVWILATLAFFGASASSWGVIIKGGWWASLALIGAIVSTAGVILVGGRWPGSPSENRGYLNSAVAMIMNLAIMTAMVWLQWLPTSWILR